MNLFVLAFLLMILVVGFVSTIIRRGNVVLIMLLPASEFLGFVDPMKIAVKGVFDIHALIALIIIVCIIVSINRINLLLKSEFFIPIGLFFLFWCYGVLYPFVTEKSSLFYSLKSSKEFITIFSFVAVLLFVKSKRDIELGWKYLAYLGIYYSVLELLSQFIGPYLKTVLTYSMRTEDMLFWKIYPPFWTVILIALYGSYYEFARQIAKPFFTVGITAIGLLLTFFRSYVLASFFVLPLVLIICGQGVSKTFLRSTFILAVISFSLLSMLLISSVTGNTFGSINEITDKFFLSAVKEVTTHSGGSLVGRDSVTESRKKLLAQSYYFGYGFIDKDSKFGKDVRKVICNDNLGFIDMGMLDIPIKFGYIGFMIFIINIIFIVYILTKIAKKCDNEVLKVRCMSLAAIAITFVSVLPVHAPLTYSYGLLPFGIALGLVEKERLLMESGT